MHNPRIEIIQTEETYLILDPAGTRHAQQLKSALGSYGASVHIAPDVGRSESSYDAVFCIDPSFDFLDTVHKKYQSRIAVICTKSQKQASATAAKVRPNTQTKVIFAPDPKLSEHDVESILWFLTQASDENLYRLHTYSENVPQSTQAKEHIPFRKRTIVFMFFAAALFFQLLFIPFLGYTLYQEYQAVQAVQKGSFSQAKKMLPQIDTSLQTTQMLYTISGPTLHFFSIAQTPEDLISLAESAHKLLSRGIPLATELRSFGSNILEKQETNTNAEILKKQQDEIVSEIYALIDELTFFHAKIPEWTENSRAQKKQIGELLETLNAVRTFIPHAHTLLGTDGPKTYLLLFANNMELRPGGGFIGSFGTLTVNQFAVDTLTVYDVYDADGQLSAHVEPPEPIRKYLNQPHWFLRDSAFSPSFPDNYQTARAFLRQEMQMNSFDGGIILTTSAIQKILDGMGPIYVPEYKETISGDNFYIKAQLYAETDFFPGSTQKKAFLSAVADALVLELAERPRLGALEGLIDALNHKQIAAVVADDSIQDEIDSKYWSGRILHPVCTVTDHPCAPDYLFPYEANLGVNKANFYVTKSVSLDVTLNEDRSIESRLHFRHTNSSPNDVLPGGTYKTYMQVMLPRNAQIRSLSVNNKLIHNFDESTDLYKTIGWYTEIPHQKESDVVIDYTQLPGVVDPEFVYQLIVQKQIGSPDSDFRLTLHLPPSFSIRNQNFSALVKDQSIIYNTSINADKIFLVELASQ